MRLYDLVDKDLLIKHVNEGLVSYQSHPTLPLGIYNYTHKAQFEPHWGDGTIDYCRGLIVDHDQNIIARPFKKFHNLNTLSIPETVEGNLPKSEPLVTRKYDGSLGIFWQFAGQCGIATRGSFTSPQAIWATKWLHSHMEEHGLITLMKDWDPGWLRNFTPLFEIVYNENRIVVQYDFEGLILIGAVHLETGMEMCYPGLREMAEENGLRVTEEFSGKSIGDLVLMNEPNEEGYVVTYPQFLESPLKVKIKMADYVRLHRVVTGMNARSVWEMLKSGADFEKFLMGYPEAFTKWLFQWRKNLVQDYSQLLHEIYLIYELRPLLVEGESLREYRKRFAAYAVESPPKAKALLFLLFDGKPIGSAIWDMIEPRGDDRSFREEEV